uniref:Carbamoyltransferase n=1 Tax=Staphylothermus marinus TaxID=2280 RepID=A0A7J3PKA0_STAMA
MKAYRLIVTGLVQGVGFRPFIHRLAVKNNVNGFVRNIGGSEVEIWIEGFVDNIERFVESIKNDKPIVAYIDEVIIEEKEPQGYTSFQILPSSSDRITRSNIPPDFAICRDCLNEILDPSNRRYRYPFNSCAYCGPRFSYIYKVPYDRENTAMSKYRLCKECLIEYNDLENIRRYHAEGISCPNDGPRLYLINAKTWESIETKDPVTETAKLIDEGYIVAIKGIGGFHIACLASCDETVLKLRYRKRRLTKPFAVMGLNTSVLEKLVYIDESDRFLLESPQSPILLLPKKPDTPVSKYVSPGLSHEGVFIAYTPLHYLLLMETRDKFLVMTSGNIHGEPMCIDEDCVRNRLKNIVDYVLTHDRVIVNRVDDSVLRKTLGNYVFLRRSRGYAPQWIRLKKDLSGVFIGFGSDLNNVFSIGFENKIVMSQYIGDLDSFEAQRDLLKYLDFLVHNYHIDPSKAIVVVDKHPQYVSRSIGYEYASRYNTMVIDIQHHYAHAIGALYEAGLEGSYISLVIDGLGWGDDNTIWGGELLVINDLEPVYSRIGSINQLPLTSDRDTFYPMRLLVGLMTIMGYDWNDIERLLSRLGVYDKSLFEYTIVYKLVQSNKYTPASSTGRLIDLVSALLNVCSYRSYDGEPAIKLEALADRADRIVDIPGFRIVNRDGLNKLDYYSAIEWLIENRDLLSPEVLARSFLYNLGYWFGELLTNSIKGLRIENTVLISGGAAVNNYIGMGFKQRLDEDDLKLYIPLKIPLNDEGVCFGQVVAASLYRNKLY